jgi:hypothetical protein
VGRQRDGNPTLPRAAAMLARPEVRQAAMACSRNSTAVGALLLPTRTAG